MNEDAEMPIVEATRTPPEPDAVSLPSLHHFTVDEYVRAAELFGWERTELVGGVVYDMAAEYNAHHQTVMRIVRKLMDAFPDHELAAGGSVLLHDDSMVQPDVCVYRDDGELDPNWVIPADVVVVAVEVSMSTLRYDLGLKRRAYASAGVPEYWVVDRRDDGYVLIRHSEPVEDRYDKAQELPLADRAEGLDVDLVLGRSTANPSE